MPQAIEIQTRPRTEAQQLQQLFLIRGQILYPQVHQDFLSRTPILNCSEV